MAVDDSGAAGPPKSDPSPRSLRLHLTTPRTCHLVTAGTFEAFLDHLPNVVKETRNGRCFFQIRPDPPQ